MFAFLLLLLLALQPVVSFLNSSTLTGYYVGQWAVSARPHNVVNKLDVMLQWLNGRTSEQFFLSTCNSLMTGTFTLLRLFNVWERVALDGHCERKRFLERLSRTLSPSNMIKGLSVQFHISYEAGKRLERIYSDIKWDLLYYFLHYDGWPISVHGVFITVEGATASIIIYSLILQPSNTCTKWHFTLLLVFY